MIKGSSDFVEGSSSLNVTTVPGLAVIRIVVVEILFLIYHVTSGGHVFKRLCDVVG